VGVVDGLQFWGPTAYAISPSTPTKVGRRVAALDVAET
jgi:hypothetical protein